MNLHFLQPEAYSFPFWWPLHLPKLELLLKNKQAIPGQVRKSNAKVM